MGAVLGNLFSQHAIIPLVAGLVLLICGAFLLVGLGTSLRRRVTQRRQREQAERELGLAIPAGVDVRPTSRHRQPGAFLLAYPRWRYAHQDYTRDRQRLGNRVIKRWSVLEIGQWRLVSTDLFAIYDLVLELRTAGMAVACSQQELNKLRAREAQVLARRHGSCVDGIAAAFAGAPEEFPSFCADLFRGAGHRVAVARNALDGGFDLRLWRDGRSSVVACSCQNPRRPVGRSVIQRLQKANIVEGADDMILVTTGPLSADAAAVAGQVGVRVVEGENLVSMFQRVWGCSRARAVMPGSVVRLTRTELLIGFPADMRHRSI